MVTVYLLCILSLSMAIRAPFPSLDDVPADICMFEHCAKEMFGLMSSKASLATFACIAKADIAKPEEMLNCEVYWAMKGDINPWTALSTCIFSNKCRAQYPDDGTCLVDTTSGQANLTSVADIEGKWWVTKGVNPHYDNLAC